MDIFNKLIQSFLPYSKESHKIGLSQFKETPVEERKNAEPMLKSKKIKISDLMRGESVQS